MWFACNFRFSPNRFPCPFCSEPNVLDESQGMLEEGNLSRYSVTALCLRCLTVCVPGLGLFSLLITSTESSQRIHTLSLSSSFCSSLFISLVLCSLSLSYCPSVSHILSLPLYLYGVNTNAPLLSLCGSHVISSEPCGAMVSIHVSAFSSLLKLEFLAGGPICGAQGYGLAGVDQEELFTKVSGCCAESHF